MVSNYLLCYVNLRLNQIFGSVKSEPFAGVTVIIVGDFFQLPPIGGKPVYALYRNNWQNFDSLWRHFKMFELTEIMTKPGASRLIDLLNNVQITNINSTDIKLLESRVIRPRDDRYSHDLLQIFAENANTKQHDLNMLQCDSNASMKNINSDAFAKRNLWVPSEKTEADINFNQ